MPRCRIFRVDRLRADHFLSFSSFFLVYWFGLFSHVMGGVRWNTSRNWHWCFCVLLCPYSSLFYVGKTGNGPGLYI